MIEKYVVSQKKDRTAGDVTAGLAKLFNVSQRAAWVLPGEDGFGYRSTRSKARPSVADNQAAVARVVVAGADY